MRGHGIQADNMNIVVLPHESVTLIAYYDPMAHGPGGTGKSMLASLISDAAGVPSHEMDGSAGSAAFRVAGLEAGERVVLFPSAELSDGARVRPRQLAPRR